jgi:hypothetical protein
LQSQGTSGILGTHERVTKRLIEVDLPIKRSAAHAPREVDPPEVHLHPAAW